MKRTMRPPAATPARVDRSRRRLTIALLAAPVIAACTKAIAEPTIRVWTGPSCGCCHDWVEHMRQSGFNVETFDGGNVEARSRLGMPVQYGSCHTGEIDGYVVEGHVPANDILRLLDERPDAVGVAVPGMPFGSPGMDGPAYGDRRDPYDVLLVRRDGSAEIFQSHR
jgi:hypothetical protein